MSSLSLIEKRKLERLFRMSGGYVLNFSNRTFQETVTHSVGIDTYDEKYGRASKANILRSFWSKEPDHIVGKLLNDLIECYIEEGSPASILYGECCDIAKRLLDNAPVHDMEAITPNAAGKDFDALAKSVRESIEKNKPEVGLDRLHTFVVKYVRVLCEKHGLGLDREKPLHSIFGENVKTLKNDGLIESQMTERILKSSISVLDAFNEVRNNQKPCARQSNVELRRKPFDSEQHRESYEIHLIA